MARINLKKLVGTEIVSKETVTENIVGRAVKKTKWTVIEAYPYHVRVMRITEDGRPIYESFSIGDLIQMGAIETPHPRYGNSYRLYRPGYGGYDDGQ